MTLLDHRLVRHLREFEAKDSRDRESFPIPVFVRYTGDVEILKNLGLKVTVDTGKNLLSGTIDVANLAALASLESVVELRAHERHRLHLNTSVPQIEADVVRTGSPSYTGAKVVVGIVDTGIDIFHKNFLTAGGKSRILWIWDQTLKPTGSQKSPAPFTIGVEFSPDDIAAGLSNPSQPFAHLDNNGHGTHVAGIAAGNGSQSGNCHEANTFWGVAPNADLIIVKVQPDNPGPDDTFPASPNQLTDPISAFKYIFQKAAAITPSPEPVVINFSAGTSMDPHDGQSNQDLLVDSLLTGAPGQVIVTSAGNDGALGDVNDFSRGDYGSGTHTSKSVAAKGTCQIPIMIPAKIAEPLEFNIWYSGGAGRLQISLTPAQTPATAMTPISPTNTFSIPLAGCTFSGFSQVNLSNGKSEIRGTLTPPSKGLLPAGLWTVTLTETAGTAVNLDLWIEAQETYNQPVLTFPDRIRGTTIGSPGSAKNVITVGACGSEDGKLAEFSSRGPTLASDNRQKPDICAPGLENSPSEGILAPRSKERSIWICCDCCLDFYVAKQGTSMSAPHVAGLVALMLEKNPNLTAEQIRTGIITYPQKNPSMGTLPNNDWGNGEIDAQLAVANIPPGPPLSGGGGSSSGGSGSGSGSVGGTPPTSVPIPTMAAAFSPPAMRIASRLRDVAARGRDVPAAQSIMALVSRHFDEVYRLIHSNRRVAGRWHRMFGPELLRHMLWGKEGIAPLIPATIRNQDIGSRMRGLFDVLSRYGSAGLRKDIDEHGALFLALPGTTFSDLSFIPPAEFSFAPSRNA